MQYLFYYFFDFLVYLIQNPRNGRGFATNLWIYFGKRYIFIRLIFWYGFSFKFFSVFRLFTHLVGIYIGFLGLRFNFFHGIRVVPKYLIVFSGSAYRIRCWSNVSCGFSKKYFVFVFELRRSRFQIWCPLSSHLMSLLWDQELD